MREMQKYAPALSFESWKMMMESVGKVETASKQQREHTAIEARYKIQASFIQ